MRIVATNAPAVRCVDLLLKPHVRNVLIMLGPAPDMGIFGLLLENNYLLLAESGVALLP